MATLRQLILEEKCPYCNTPDAYVGLWSVECSNPKCKAYSATLAGSALIAELNRVKPSYLDEVALIAKAFKANVAVDNSGGDSDGAPFAIDVVTPSCGPRNFQGPQFEFDVEEDDPDDLTHKEFLERVRAFLKKHDVQAVVSTAEDRAMTPDEYVAAFG